MEFKIQLDDFYLEDSEIEGALKSYIIDKGNDIKYELIGQRYEKTRKELF